MGQAGRVISIGISYLCQPGTYPRAAPPLPLRAFLLLQKKGYCSSSSLVSH